MLLIWAVCTFSIDNCLPLLGRTKFQAGAVPFGSYSIAQVSRFHQGLSIEKDADNGVELQYSDSDPTAMLWDILLD